MLLSEIAEHVVKYYPNCCMASNNNVQVGNREEWYEEYLIEPLMDFFAYEIVDLCGCGNPEETNETIRRLLNIRYDWSKKYLTYEEMQKRYEQDLHISMKDNVNYGLWQFMMYKLDSCGILEHGGSIGGAWLTNLGEMYRTVLNAWYEQENKQ